MGAVVILEVIIIYLFVSLNCHIYFLTGFVMVLYVLLVGFNILHSYTELFWNCAGYTKP